MKLNLITGIVAFALSGVLSITNSDAERYPLAKTDKTTDVTEGNNNAQQKSSGTNSLLAGCAEPNGSTFIEFNNVRALIHTGGDMFWDLNNDVKYEIPKNSLKHSMFLASLWLGGTDVNGQLRIAAQRYRYAGVDFWTGPLDTSGTAEITPDVCAEWDKHFIIERQEVDEFVAWFNNPEDFPKYVIPNRILEWPAHGDVSKGQSYYLAPFFDKNGDGFYDPFEGDYPFYDLDPDELTCNRSRDRQPKLFGDITFWFVFNDKGNIHKETEGDAIGLEVQAQQFAFATNDEINNMTFTNYRIINRSTFTLIDTYFGTNFDPDLGDPSDDYVGCDVKRGLGYCYNGEAVDGTGGVGHYGANPPAIGVDFFEGPFQDPDGVDNPADSACNAYMNGSINGLNFGDGEIDNERWGMRRFVFYCNTGPECLSVQGDPNIAVHYYSYLRGFWKDGTRMVYGGNGHINNCTSCDEYADFMFPGAKSIPTQTDECNWGVCQNPDGTNCGITPGDPLPWTEQQADNVPGDRRFVHSAGPFTLAPGAENDITVGIVWARATSGGDPFQSVELLRLADDKAQALFDNCFRVLNGPDAPVLTCQELNREIILYLSNPITSNNTLEQYFERDPLIIPPLSFPGSEEGEIIDVFYRFQGYQIFQLKDSSVSVTDVGNIELARLVAQVDIKDDVSKLINWEHDETIGTEVPTLKVNGNNVGISHSFKVTDDLFATGVKTLVNHKKYYFLALAYSHNQFLIWDSDSLEVNGNRKPYLAGRKTGFGGAIEAITCIPHISTVELNGTEVNSNYGDSPEITRIEGQGNGGLVLDLSAASINAIMAGEPWRTEQLKYVRNAGPVGIKIIDPLKVSGGKYVIKFFHDRADSISITGMPPFPVNKITAGKTFFEVDKSFRDEFSVGQVVYIDGSLANDGEWTIFNIANSTQNSNNLTIFTEEHLPSIDKNQMGVVYPGYKWALLDAANQTDTMFISEQNINTRTEQLIPELGISITVEQVRHPGPAYAVPANLTGLPAVIGAENPDPANGFLEASMTFADPNLRWLTGIVDGDAPNGLNWIKAGTVSPGTPPTPTPADDYVGIDDKGIYENVLGGIWSPGRLCNGGFDIDTLGPVVTIEGNDRSSMAYLASVNLYITTDKSKWTRAVVLEQQENYIYTKPIGSNIPKLNLRGGLSVDKNGVPFDITGSNSISDPPSTNPNDANYIANTGMGWFPGYAINIETGERLNIMFGEDSWLINGNDMIWNPSSYLTNPTGQDALDQGSGCVGCAPPTCSNNQNSNNPCLPFWAGGKHYIYIMGHNGDDTTNINQARGDIPSYDAGAYIRQVMDGAPSDNEKLSVFSDVMWVGLPLLDPDYDDSDPFSAHYLHQHGMPPSKIPTNITIRLRVQKPYGRNFSTDSVSSTTPLNNNNPMYQFDLEEFKTRTDVNDIAVDALENINIVPNPYFAFSTYETSQIDHRVKIINLPVKCTVSIYSLNGTLIRQFKRDDETITSIDWDLKNFKSVPIASGVYLIHVNAPGIGERVLKWFGVLRPIDLDSF